MASQLESLAAAVRGVGKDAGEPLQILRSCRRDLEAAARAVDAAHSTDGPRVTAALVGALRGVADAVTLLEAFGAQSEGFADQLIGGSGAKGGGRSAGPGAPVPAASPVSSAPEALDARLMSHGMTLIDVSAVDFSDNPLQGAFGRGGADRSDYDWTVKTWNDVVGPGVARGMTRDDFAAQDSSSGAPALRRTADVYDLFLGDTDRIRASYRPDGSLDLGNGRHRAQAARALGIQWLPAQVWKP